MLECCSDGGYSLLARFTAATAGSFVPDSDEAARSPPAGPGPDLQSGHSGPVGTQPGETIVGLIFLNLVKGQAENNFYPPVYDGLVHGLVASQCKLDLRA